MKFIRCPRGYKIIGICKEEDITMEGNVLNLKSLIKGNISRAIDLAKQSNKYNEKGEAVLSKDDEWREDNEWNNYYDKL